MGLAVNDRIGKLNNTLTVNFQTETEIKRYLGSGGEGGPQLRRQVECKQFSTCAIGDEKDSGTVAIIKEKTAQIFPKLMKTCKPQSHEVVRTPSRIS